MQSSNARRATVLIAIALASSAGTARADDAEGFAVERFYASAPGAGWLVMDTLDMQGGLGGAMSLTLGYSRAPLRAESLTVVSDRAFAKFGFAATYDRFRIYLDLEMPLVAAGESGTVGGYAFAAPNLDPSSHPDTLADPRIGFDARILGSPGGPFRLGAGVQLFVPNGLRSDYVTDDTYRAMARALVAGDLGRFTYAAHLGAHFRPLDDGAVPGSPRGSEILFGLAAGPQLVLGPTTSLVVGPEVFGETAWSALLASRATGVEAMLSGRIEHIETSYARLRAKVGAGGGLNAHFGAPDWRTIVSIEVVGRPE